VWPEDKPNPQNARTRRGRFRRAVRYEKDGKAFGRAIGKSQGHALEVAGMYKASKRGAACSNRACASANPFPGLILAAVATVYCNELELRVTSERIQVYAATALPMNSRCRAFTAERPDRKASASRRRPRWHFRARGVLIGDWDSPPCY
jgi:hypothetical protein